MTPGEGAPTYRRWHWTFHLIASDSRSGNQTHSAKVPIKRRTCRQRMRSPAHNPGCECRGDRHWVEQWNGALHTGHGTLEGLKSKPCRWGVNNIVRVTASGHDCCRRSGRCCGHWWCGCVFSSIELAEAAQWTPQFGYQVCILNKSVRLPKFIRWWCSSMMR